MKRKFKVRRLGIFISMFLVLFVQFNFAAITNWDLSRYEAQEGLTAELDEGSLKVQWEMGEGCEGKLRFAVEQGIPVIKELALKSANEDWMNVATELRPEFTVVSGIRRATLQQMEPLADMGVEITDEVLNEIKWDAFWDAPLFVEEEGKESSYRSSSIPPQDPCCGQPGMPRKLKEIDRSEATFNVTHVSVETSGRRLQIYFNGATTGVFSEGSLQFDVIKGSHLIRQMLVAKTKRDSVAFKYAAGLQGFKAGHPDPIQWRDPFGDWQSRGVSESKDSGKIVVKSRNRVIGAEFNGGSIAFFPPPHRFYWARESEQNLGYSWYRSDGEGNFAIGLRQAEEEEIDKFAQNFALYNARPGKWQRMSMYLCLDAGSAKDAIDRALSYTRGDRFKAIPGYKVMGRHYHVGMLKRLETMAEPGAVLNDVEAVKSVGMDIFEVIDGVRGSARHDRGEAFLEALHEYYAAARKQSDENFLLVPNDENSTGGRPPFMGGHYDLILSKPLYWKPKREEGEPLYYDHPQYGVVYNLGTPADMMAMTEREKVIVSMPHPDTKRSTGYPEAIWDEPHFMHENYLVLGYRWGMGIDASEKRLGEYRFLRVWDETNNAMVRLGAPLKYAQAISEARSDKGSRGKPKEDDIYGMSPVNYLKMDRVPTVDDMSPIVEAFRSAEYFVTSGEVLIPSFSYEVVGDQTYFVAEVEWTFPLEFVELVFGDGESTKRIEFMTRDLEEFGKKTFRLPFDPTGKAWVRFAAWDMATNGALLQPIDLR